MGFQINNIAVFDFCETITKFQTADRFVDMVTENRDGLYKNFIKFSYKILTKLRIFAVLNLIFPNLNISKRFYLLQLRGISEKIIREKAQFYFENIIYPCLNTEIIKKLKLHQENGDKIFISSGGYEPYLVLFCMKEKIDQLFCTHIDFKNNIATGFIKGKDCMFENKVELIIEFLNKNKIEYNKIFCYTDSISDLPLLKFADYPNVVSYNKSQIWPIKFGFNEIIISR